MLVGSAAISLLAEGLLPKVYGKRPSASRDITAEPTSISAKVYGKSVQKYPGGRGGGTGQGRTLFKVSCRHID